MASVRHVPPAKRGSLVSPPANRAPTTDPAALNTGDPLAPPADCINAFQLSTLRSRVPPIASLVR